MKKVLLAVALFLISVNVYAAECSYDQIQKYNKESSKITFDLNYDSSILDMNGERAEEYIEINFSNLSEDYYVTLSHDEYKVYAFYDNPKINITGGVYKVEINNYDCNSPVKSFEIRIPFYKMNCVGKECNNNVWSDGTNNLVITKKMSTESKASIFLIILLFIFLVITFVIIVLIIIKRRHKYEESL